MKRVPIALGVLAFAGVGLYGAAYLYYHARSLSESCRLIASWGGDSRLDHPMQVTWGGGRLNVADTEDRSVEQYRGDGSLVARHTGFERPVAVAATEDAIYVADFLADQVVKLSRGGEALTRWGRHGSGPGEFDAPAGIAVDGRGTVYVSDFYNHRIQRFDREGRFLGEWGERGRTRGRFRYPTGIAVGQNEVYVADAFNHRIQVFSPEGEYLRQWGGIGFGVGGSWPGWFFLAKEVALDSAGDVYVVDAFNNRLQKFTRAGKLLALWDPDDPPLRYPSGVAVGPDETVFVSEFDASRVQALQCRISAAATGT